MTKGYAVDRYENGERIITTALGEVWIQPEQLMAILPMGIVSFKHPRSEPSSTRKLLWHVRDNAPALEGLVEIGFIDEGILAELGVARALCTLHDNHGPEPTKAT